MRKRKANEETNERTEYSSIIVEVDLRSPVILLPGRHRNNSMNMSSFDLVRYQQ